MTRRDVATVTRMFREYLGGHSLRAIAVKLNADGIKTQRGNTWDGAVRSRRCLTNAAYIGRVRLG